MRKILVAALCFILTASGLAGCAPPADIGDNNRREAETLPDYLESEESTFRIGMWVGVPERRAVLDLQDKVTGYEEWTDAEFNEQYEWMRDAGFTLAAPPQGEQTTNHMLRMLHAAEAVGMEHLLWDETLNGILKDASITDEEAVVLARRATAAYAEHPAYYGNQFTDEPQVREFDAIGLARRRYQKIFPDKLFYVNLFPIGATQDQLGCARYEEYLKLYTEKVTDSFLCYDHYPLQRGTGGSTRLVDTFLYNMDLANNAVKSAGGEVWTFLQSMGYGAKKDPDCVADFGVQAYATLAYGLKGIQWFCYYSPGYGGPESFTPAIITLDGKKTSKYDMVKTVNNAVLKIGGLYSHFNYTGTMTQVGSENDRGENAAFGYMESLASHKRILSLLNAQDVVVGTFRDGDNRDGFMITNYDAPSSQNTNRVEINFKDATKAVVVTDGAVQITTLANGKLSLELAAGSGAFVIPLYIV